MVVILRSDKHVQSQQGTPEGLLLRFVGHVTYLAVSDDHTHLAAGSSEFLIKVVELKDLTKVVTFNGHEAPVLCVRFDPLGEYLVSPPWLYIRLNEPRLNQFVAIYVLYICMYTLFV